jgi:putative ABC transport system permease protein
MALGAEPRDVLKLVLWATGRVLAVGLFAGLALSIFASRMLLDRMQGMGTADPLLFAVAPGILITATLAACFLPARSATRIQPVEALRHD